MSYPLELSLFVRRIGSQKQRGAAIIFVGEDLDVLMELCDRIMVLSGGRISGTVDARTATKEQIGLLMTKSQEVTANE